uniref:Uncharacterized protein n=1 Tax=Arcella intermedia TaxID=1963864 RepID=A0A6B2KXC1_9EUKA
MLVFLEENSSDLFKTKRERVESVCTMLNGILDSVGNMVLRCQLLVTLTNIIITTDIIQEQRTFESFVDFLFDIISNVNSSPDRVLRATACECLRELEESYPGLLGTALGHFFLFAQKELSHAFAAYTALFEIVLHHQMMILSSLHQLPFMGLSSNSQLPSLPSFPSIKSPSHVPSLFDTKEPLVPFVLPENFNHFLHMIPPEQFLRIVPFEYHIEAYVTDIKRAIQFISEAVLRTPKIVQFCGVVGLIEPVRGCGVAKEAFRHRFHKFFTTDDFLQIHLVFLLLVEFTGDGVFSVSEMEEFVKRLLVAVDDYQVCWEQRFLVLDWLYYFKNLLEQLHLHQFTASPWTLTLLNLMDPSDIYFPFILDPLPIKEAKLHALVNVNHKRTSLAKNKRSKSPNYISALKCIEEFLYYGNDTPIVQSAFRVIIHFLNNVEIFKDICLYLNKVILKSPDFTQNLIGIINYFEHIETTKHIGDQILGHFNDFMVSYSSQGWENPPKSKKVTKKGQPHQTQAHYLALVHRILEDNSIDPFPLVNALQVLLRTSDICKIGSWSIGNSLLSISKVLLGTSRNRLLHVFQGLSTLLGFISVYFNNVDIRDRAHFYYMLLTHLPYDKIQSVIKGGGAVKKIEGPKMGEMDGSGIGKVAIKDVECFLEMNRLDKLFNANCIEVLNGPSNDEPSTSLQRKAEDYQLLEEYLGWINSTSLTSHDFKTRHSSLQNSTEEKLDVQSIKLSFTIRFETRPIENNLEHIYGVSITFTECPFYSPLKPLHIPFLAYRENSKLKLDSKNVKSVPNYSSYPYEYKSQLVVPVIVPIPIEVGVTAIFNDQSGNIFKSKMNTLKLMLSDFFLPVFIPPRTEKAGKEYTRELFDVFWSYLSSSSNSSDTKSPISTNLVEPELHSKSVKNLPYPKAQVLQIMNQSLKPFLLYSEDEEAGCFIFLPRKYHLLMKWKISEQSTKITILTDYWRVLTFLDAYFDLLFSKT